MAPFCTDCGTEAGLMLGWEAGVSDPSLADARVWACPVCSDSWCRHDPIADRPVGAPAGEETRNARTLLTERQVERVLAEALHENPNARAIAEQRVARFLEAVLDVPAEFAAVDMLSIEQCRTAWHALHGVSYRDVVSHSQRYRGVKRKEAA
ncbi:hypothetical protein [Methylobacterium brachythecii]|uniref:Uncharacterized protein n=1 Tax=Methylobacterium brachythecii TaxID=1176177 RepID=A0A7W6AQX1_9HYPH|nr:hypothetical protein [Methylobacterium brachythecii]MBB3905071.1 hypothetical protein [Methylobacterium brachythecii]GLS44421.1 hypothetical protein GCM10007884_24090 [Methylobacterium brachythecii]